MIDFIITVILLIMLVVLVAVVSFFAGWIVCAATDDRYDGPELTWSDDDPI